VEKGLQGVDWFNPSKTHYATSAKPTKSVGAVKVEIDNQADNKEAEGTLRKGEQRGKGWSCIVC